MIMKANKQIGFIYKDNESIDKILKDGEVVFERGFLRERTSTTLPITFGGVGKNLKDYKVYGNTVQNGEPTPDAPIDIISCGDRTKNLCGELEQGGYNETNGTKSTSTTNYRNKEPIKVLPNTNYIFSINGVGQAINVFEYKADGTYIGRIGSGVISANSYFTTSSETGYINIFRGTSAGIEKWQIEQSDTITPYEPYGYKIPVNVRSDNLFDKDNYEYITAYLNASNIITNSGNAISFYIKCKPNTTYNVSKTSLFGNDRFCLFDTSSLPTVGDTALSYVGTRAGNNNNKNLTITTNATAQYLCVFVKGSATAPSASAQNIANTLQIVEGSTAPTKYISYYNETTNIYLDEPLRKIDGYSDYIDFINGKVVRNIKEIILNGSNDEDWKKLNLTFYLQYNFSKTFNSLCTHFIKQPDNKWTSSDEIYRGKFSMFNIDNQLKFMPTDENINTLELWKTWLSSNNVTVDYALATPTEESITLPNIPTVDGNNTLNIETEITPSQVYIKYKSNT